MSNLSDPQPDETPPALPANEAPTAGPPRRKHRDLAVKVLFAVCAILVICRLLGLLRPFKIPTDAMAPTIHGGDHVLMEGASYWLRTPRRGDILVFKTKGIPGIPPDQIYTKRVIGVPGDTLAMIDNTLHLNGKQCSITNMFGESKSVTNSLHIRLSDEITIPKNEFFVIGDNHPNSSDSLAWGTVPGDNVLGRLVLRYWPLMRIGPVN